MAVALTSRTEPSNTTAVANGNSSFDESDADVSTGFELAYDRQLGVKAQRQQ